MSCKKCGGSGFIEYISQDGCQAFKECKCQKEKRAIKAIERSGLATLAEKCRLDNYVHDEEWQSRILSKAKHYVDNCQDKWFFIGGQSGSGKTHICTAITVAMIKQGKFAKFMLWRPESRRLKGIISDMEEYTRAIQSYQNANILYIDDFLKGGITNADTKLAFEILDSRYRENKPTIISSEFTTQEIINIDEAIGGRIKEMADGYVLNIKNDKKRNFRLYSKQTAQHTSMSL